MVAVLVAHGLPALSQPALDADAVRRLQAGEVIIDVSPDPQGTSGVINAVIDVPVSPQALWLVMMDCESSKRVISSLKTCRVLEQATDATFDVREHILQWMWPLPPVRSVFRSDFTPYQRIAFRRVEGDLAAMEGEWRLEPLQNGQATRLTYIARITPGWPIPGPLVRAALEADVPKTLTGLRREAVTRP